VVDPVARGRASAIGRLLLFIVGQAATLIRTLWSRCFEPTGPAGDAITGVVVRFTSMNKPKLTYFDAPVSLGEKCRLALHLAGIDFDAFIPGTRRVVFLRLLRRRGRCV
jgi:hypothetical protein